MLENLRDHHMKTKNKNNYNLNCLLIVMLVETLRMTWSNFPARLMLLTTVLANTPKVENE
jgi:hypothetical protein